MSPPPPAAAGELKPHAVVVPYPLQGHLIPTVQLALSLAARGFSITFINTEAIHQQVSRAAGAADAGDPFAAARASGHDIRYEVISDGLPATFDRSLNHDQFMASLLHVLSAHVEQAARRAVAPGRPTCLVADTFFVWPATLARKLGILYVSFWTEAALVFSLYYHSDLLISNGHFKGSRKDAITYVPGVAAIEPADLMSYLQDEDVTTVVHQIIFKAFDQAKLADFVLANTVDELEPDTIAALAAVKPFYAVGPIFPDDFRRRSVETSLWTESDCSAWLDAQPAASVLYISFGSYAHVTKADLGEIARGVLASGVRFLWVLRPDVVSSDDPEPLPAGFREAAGDRGLVVSWCTQKAVLSHAAVGGFFTHCGWNSVLESVWCGVPMLCFPLLTDQFTNRRLVVKDWKSGAAVGEVEAGKVSEKIQGLMKGKEGAAATEAAAELRKKLEKARTSEGSSTKNFGRFVEDLLAAATAAPAPS